MNSIQGTLTVMNHCTETGPNKGGVNMAIWSDEELGAAVKAYQWMLDQQAAGKAVNKKDVYRGLVETHGRTTGAWDYRMQNISAVMSDLGRGTVAGLMPATNVGAGVTARLVNIINGESSEPAQVYKYGNKRTWELALDAITELGGTANLAQVTQRALKRTPELKPSNVGADLNFLAVNSPSRVSYTGADKPRRTDSGDVHDKLFKIGSGQDVIYELYRPEVHGVWEIFPDANAENKRKLSVRRITDPVEVGLSEARDEASKDEAFDADGLTDARMRVYASIVRRQGQPAFRKALLAAYEGRCAVTGCDVKDVLEAAHVHPYRGTETNVTANGILLRADIHTLFDLYQISIDPATLTLRLAPALLQTTYGALDGVHVASPKRAGDKLSQEVLAWRRAQCVW